jgi:hypothetical protein
MKKIALLITVGLFTMAQADVVVNFTAPAATAVNARAADTNIAGQGSAVWNFSDNSNPLFNKTDITNGKVHGGFITTWAGGSTYTPAFTMGTVSSANTIQLSVSAGTVNTTLKGMLVWDKNDFLGAAQSQKISFSDGDYISYTTGPMTGTPDIRIVVKQGLDWYVSGMTGQAGTTAYSNNTAALAALTWYGIDTGTYAIGSAKSITLTDIDAVGLSIQNFTVSAIPEPATIGMLGLGGLVAVLLRRQRRI